MSEPMKDAFILSPFAALRKQFSKETRLPIHVNKMLINLQIPSYGSYFPIISQKCKIVN